jgi:O-methyltransferase involved in polyketide biosynthesis
VITSSVVGVTDAGLVGVQKTLSPVLRAKALDNRLPDPILGDKYAEQAMRRLDPDYDKRRFGTSQIGLAAVVRAKAHDDWARYFLAAHPDAVVLHLGCGLDARVYRIDPPSTVDWYDLDYPAITELRRQFLPPREHYTLIGSSVTDPTWLDRVVRDRPVLMIAEGLVPYLTEAAARALLTSVVDAFPPANYSSTPCRCGHGARRNGTRRYASTAPGSSAASTIRPRWPIGTPAWNTSTRRR